VDLRFDVVSVLSAMPNAENLDLLEEDSINDHVGPDGGEFPSAGNPASPVPVRETT